MHFIFTGMKSLFCFMPLVALQQCVGQISIFSKILIKVTKSRFARFCKLLCEFLKIFRSDLHTVSEPPKAFNRKQDFIPVKTNCIVQNTLNTGKYHFRTIGGFMTEEKWQKELEELDALIEKQGLKVDKSHYYINGYDSPFKLFNRKNELWRIKLEE